MSQALALEDPALLEALRRGDVRAFDVAYDALRPRVFGFLWRLGGDRAVAEELTQEALLRLARAAPTLPPGTLLRGWVFAVARNLHRDHQRRRWLDFDRRATLATWPTATPAVPTPAELVTSAHTQQRLERALAALPPLLRETVLLVCVEGLLPAEVATALQLPADTVRQRLSRGRAALRAALEEP